jgi:HSP20 family protein
MIWPVTRFDWTLDPFQELHRMQRDMNRLFADYASPADQFPTLNLCGNESEAVLAAEIPGVDPKAVEISVVGNVLTLEGERKAEADVTPGAYHRRERGSGKFLRSVRLPFEVEADRVQAKYEHGVVRITLPRKESTKPRRIAIAAE